ncbi:hypothetical protein GGX14DRAFT_406678 [Mycena pura]|uniref:Uncharacterized protein n=1 Tax=Mycena pura TaxID=153505 RepID=A0AAD6XZJ2_9AGAR|nr:hypothetical protein GGX14DRAFT_406678 [Mycena pura]
MFEALQACATWAVCCRLRPIAVGSESGIVRGAAGACCGQRDACAGSKQRTARSERRPACAVGWEAARSEQWAACSGKWMACSGFSLHTTACGRVHSEWKWPGCTGWRVTSGRRTTQMATAGGGPLQRPASGDWTFLGSATPSVRVRRVRGCNDKLGWRVASVGQWAAGSKSGSESRAGSGRVRAQVGRELRAKGGSGQRQGIAQRTRVACVVGWGALNKRREREMGSGQWRRAAESEKRERRATESERPAGCTVQRAQVLRRTRARMRRTVGRLAGGGHDDGVSGAPRARGQQMASGGRRRVLIDAGSGTGTDAAQARMRRTTGNTAQADTCGRLRAAGGRRRAAGKGGDAGVCCVPRPLVVGCNEEADKPDSHSVHGRLGRVRQTGPGGGGRRTLAAVSGERRGRFSHNATGASGNPRGRAGAGCIGACGVRRPAGCGGRAARDEGGRGGEGRADDEKSPNVTAGCKIVGGPGARQRAATGKRQGERAVAGGGVRWAPAPVAAFSDVGSGSGKRAGGERVAAGDVARQRASGGSCALRAPALARVARGEKPAAAAAAARGGGQRAEGSGQRAAGSSLQAHVPQEAGGEWQEAGGGDRSAAGDGKRMTGTSGRRRRAARGRRARVLSANAGTRVAGMSSVRRGACRKSKGGGRRATGSRWRASAARGAMQGVALSNAGERGWWAAGIGCSSARGRVAGTGVKKRWRPAGGGGTGRGQRAAGSERRVACGVFVVGGAAGSVDGGQRAACGVRCGGAGCTARTVRCVMYDGGRASSRARVRRGCGGRRAVIIADVLQAGLGRRRGCLVLAVISAYFAGSWLRITDARGAGNGYATRGEGTPRPRRALPRQHLHEKPRRPLPGIPDNCQPPVADEQDSPFRSPSHLDISLPTLQASALVYSSLSVAWNTCALATTFAPGASAAMRVGRRIGGGEVAIGSRKVGSIVLEDSFGRLYRWGRSNARTTGIKSPLQESGDGARVDPSSPTLSGVSTDSTAEDDAHRCRGSYRTRWLLGDYGRYSREKLRVVQGEWTGGARRAWFRKQIERMTKKWSTHRFTSPTPNFPTRLRASVQCAPGGGWQAACSGNRAASGERWGWVKRAGSEERAAGSWERPCGSQRAVGNGRRPATSALGPYAAGNRARR